LPSPSGGVGELGGDPLSPTSGGHAGRRRLLLLRLHPTLQSADAVDRGVANQHLGGHQPGDLLQLALLLQVRVKRLASSYAAKSFTDTTAITTTTATSVNAATLAHEPFRRARTNTT